MLQHMHQLLVQVRFLVIRVYQSLETEEELQVELILEKEEVTVVQDSLLVVPAVAQVDMQVTAELPGQVAQLAPAVLAVAVDLAQEIMAASVEE
jgi:hypothetical protein